MAELPNEQLADDVRAERVSVRAATVREPGARCEPVARLSIEAADATFDLQGKHGDGIASRRLHLLAAGLIAIAVAVIGARDIAGGGVGWSDGANHLFDGIFVYEFVREMPLDSPMAWAEQFYLRHPSLGIVVYWPPGFAAFEAIVFAVFGVSLVAARCVVLAFAFGAGYVMFRLVRDLYGGATGLIAALLFVTCPFGERWMTDIMLEWPATFWILLATWAFARGVLLELKRDTREMQIDEFSLAAMSARDRRSQVGWSLLCGASIVAAFLTKQTAGFILPVIVMHSLLFDAGRRWLFRTATIVALLLSVGIVVAYSILARPYAGLASSLLSLNWNFAWYFFQGSDIFGWGILISAMVGLPAAWREHDRRKQLEGHDGYGAVKPGGLIPADKSIRPARFFVLWFVVWYAFSSAIDAKELRYMFFAIPPVVAAAAWGIQSLAQWNASRRAAVIRSVALAGVFIAFNSVMAITNSRGRLPSYAPAVDLLVAQGNADLVLVDAVRDGQFVFDVYQHPDARDRIVPLRASKLLYARAARMKYGGELRVESEAEIIELLDRFGIRHIVMESQAPRTNDASIDPRPRKLLRRLVADSTRFARRGAWPLACDDPDWAHVELHVYEYLACPPRSTDRVTIPVPAMGREVEIELPRQLYK